MSMKMLAVLWVLGALVATAAAVSRPPGIYLEPGYDVYYKAKETVSLPCQADGEPRPSYTWKRNEIDFNPSGNDDRIVILPNVGTLVFNSPEDKDEGIFQCFAENDFGRSASKKINFREAKLEAFSLMDPTIHLPRLGLAYTLPCVPPESVPPASVVWFIVGRGMEAVNYDARVSMDREYRLRFTNVKPQDSMDGRAYACVAMNDLMRLSQQGPLHYIKPAGTAPEMIPTEYLWADQDDRFALRGETFSMKCIFAGNPTPDVHWERTDNRSLPDRAKLKSFAQELEISDVQFEDAGTYECWATNDYIGGNRVIRTFNLRVNSRPYFIREPQDVETSVGADVEFTCEAYGVPGADIDWFVNGVPLKDITDERLTDGRFKRPVENKVFFENVQQTDSLVIQCNASNIHGYVFADIYLNVLAEAPTILVPPEAKKVSAEGQPVNLTCQTTGKPDPIITWYKDGLLITGGRYQLLQTGDLHIRSAVLADAGHYYCTAENLYNKTSAEGSLVIRRKTRIEFRPLDLEVNAGIDAKFTCSGTTDPEEVQNLKIKWLKDGKELMTQEQRMFTNIQDSSLTISGTIQRDSGTYTCIATNGLDNDMASAYLTVKDRPDAPYNVYHKYCNKNATIVWTPGSFNNAPVQYYVLQYNTSFNPDQWNFGLRVNSTVNTVNMTLSPYVNYTFRIIAFNKIGPSDPSASSSIVCTTKPDRPYYHPRNLRTLGHQSGKLYIEWTPIPEIQQNGPGFYYSLQILRQGAPVSEMQNIAIDTWRTNHWEMSTGRVYEPYRITLKAGNSVGEASADPTTITGYSYEGAPTIMPTNVMVEEVGDTYAVFKWDFDKSEIGKLNTRIRGEFMGFKIQFWEQNKRAITAREFDIGPESAKNTTGNTFTARVDDMLPNTDMEAQIAVRNNYYIGPRTDVVRFRTEPGYPGVVQFFRPITIGDTHINLEWGSPFENRGDLVGYDISYQLVTGLDLGEMQEREPQINDPYTTNAYLSGLSPSSKYRIHIYARTAKGRGEGYFIESVTAKAGTPRMPRFTIADVSTTYINVSWWVNAYATSGTIVFVEYRKLDGPEWLRTTDEVVNTWKKISNLEPGTTYELRIKATNGVTSMASGIDEVTTDGTALASALVGNIGWFCGMLLSILLIIGLVILFVVCYRRGFRFAQRERAPYYGGAAHETYSGTYDNTAHIDSGSDRFGAEPRGYNNDYYDEKDYHNYEDGDEKRPPSYNSDEYDRDRYPPPSAPPDKEYEDYGRKPSDGYDPEYDHGEPNKFDKNGRPVEHGYDDDYRGDYRDDYREDYRDDYQDDYRGDYRDDNRQHDDYYDRRNDSYDRGDYRDDRRDYYDEEPRRIPSVHSSHTSVSGTKPSTSTFV